MSCFRPVVLETEIFQRPHPIFTLCDYPPFEEGLALYLDKPKLIEIGQLHGFGEDLKKSVYFNSFAIISRWRREIPLI
jgi:hypothetical protein